MNHGKRTKAEELRHRAQERFQARAPAAPGLISPAESVRIVHELQVHQVELEIQNEELCDARARAEAAIARYTDLYDFAPLAYFTLGRDGKITQANLAGARLIGIDRVRLMGRAFHDFVAPADAPVFNACIQRVFAGQPRQTCQIGLATKTQVQTVARIEMTLSADGLECCANVVDITEIQRTAAALRQTQFSMDHAPVAIVWIRPDATFAYVNDATCRMLGYSQAELQAKSVPDVNAELTLPRWRANWARLKREGSLSYRGVLIGKSGRSVPVELTANYLAFEGREFCCSFARDISEHQRAEATRLELEAQLNQAHKLESIGTLAGGVAHDFNNILAAILLQSNLLQASPGLDGQARETLKDLTDNAQRAAALTRQLLMFSRRSPLEVKVLDLNEAVANLLKMLGRLIGEHLRLRFEPCAGLPLVEADLGMIEQVLMNLTLNACDAMPKAGCLTIALAPVHVDAEKIAGRTWVAPGLFACLAVTDTGAGMDEDTLKRVFEPFFTTKAPGVGTGLGLATVYGIVAQHKGWVEAESKPGKGSTFRAFFPATQRTVTPAPAKEPAPVQGVETILLVEDEASVRRTVGQVLGRLGYRVLEAEDGKAALKAWHEHAGQIDLLFSDMIMPENVTGLDLAAILRKEQPGLKVIISSGYDAERAEIGRGEAEDIVYLQKPCQIDVLSRTVRECLDGRRGVTRV